MTFEHNLFHTKWEFAVVSSTIDSKTYLVPFQVLLYDGEVLPSEGAIGVVLLLLPIAVVHLDHPAASSNLRPTILSFLLSF